MDTSRWQLNGPALSLLQTFYIGNIALRQKSHSLELGECRAVIMLPYAIHMHPLPWMYLPLPKGQDNIVLSQWHLAYPAWYCWWEAWVSTETHYKGHNYLSTLLQSMFFIYKPEKQDGFQTPSSSSRNNSSYIQFRIQTSTLALVEQFFECPLLNLDPFLVSKSCVKWSWLPFNVVIWDQ